MTDREKMGDVDHTHPHRDRPAGALFRRGPTVIVDGGQREATDDEPQEGGDRA